MYGRTLSLLLATALAMGTGSALSGIGTNLQVSAELGTNLARENFPVTIAMRQARLFITEPTVLFINEERIGIQVKFQAYDHRPDAGVAVSETGNASFSGRLDYDTAARKVLLHEPRIDSLKFDRDTPDAQALAKELRAAWSSQISDPLRSDLPNHPYLLPFRENINDLSFDGENIIVSIQYQ